jgi:hypothetical protein
MARTEELRNVPKADVCRVVMGFIADGATRVLVSRNPNTGRWNIEATFR